MEKRLINALFIYLLIMPILSSAHIGKKVTIGLEKIAYPPRFNYQNNNAEGSDIVLISKAFSQLGLQVKWRSIPTKKLLPDLLEHKVDFIFPDNPLWNARLKKRLRLHYSNIIQQDLDGFFVLPENIQRSFASFDAVGALKHFTIKSWKKYAKENKIKIFYFSTIKKLLNAVIYKKIQAAFLSKQVGEYYINYILTNSTKLIFDHSQPNISYPYYLATIYYPKLLSRFNLAIKAVKQSGNYISIIKK